MGYETLVHKVVEKKVTKINPERGTGIRFGVLERKKYVIKSYNRGEYK